MAVSGLSAALDRIWPGMPTNECLVVAAVLISNLGFVVAATGLYSLSIIVLGSEERGFCSALLFCATPANVFMTTAYSESFFAATSFWGLALAARCCLVDNDDLDPTQFASAALLLFVASAIRSIGVLSVAVPVWAMLRLILSPLAKGGTTSGTSNLRAASNLAAMLVVTAVFSFAAIAPSKLVEAHGYRRFCTGGTAGQLPSWCDKETIYSHVQQTYWDVGPFMYWQLKQVPNFLLATPAVALCAHCAVAHLRHLWSRPAPIAALLSASAWRRNETVLPVNAAPFVAAWIAVTVVGVVVINVQVLTRLVAVGCPAAYWYAELLLRTRPSSIAKYIRIVIVLYNVMGPLLHSNFYPWT